VEESVPLVLGERKGEKLGRYPAAVIYYIFSVTIMNCAVSTRFSPRKGIYT
jgi:hypothetical protein